MARIKTTTTRRSSSGASATMPMIPLSSRPSEEQLRIREQRKAEWWRTPDPSKHPLYPGDNKADLLVRDAKLEQQKAAIDDTAFFDKSVFRSSLLWKTFHFAFVSPVLSINVQEWFRIREFVDYHDLEDIIDDVVDVDVVDDSDDCDLDDSDDCDPDFGDYWKCEDGKLVDIDLSDAVGKIWKMRMVWVEGGGAMEGFYGYYGKVFDRTDPGKRVLFDINQGYQSETEFNRTEHFHNSGNFVDHDNLRGIMKFLREDICGDILRNPFYNGDILRNQFYTFSRVARDDDDDNDVPDVLNQPSFLLAVALLVAQTNPGLEPQWPVSTPFVSTQLRLLCKASSQVDDDTTTAARRVLCASDDVRGLIAAYASEAYVLPQGSASTDNSMDWYTQRFRWLCHSVRCQEEGNNDEGKAAYNKFCRDEEEREESIMISCHRSSPQLLKPWLLGMESDTIIFPSPSVEELEKFVKGLE